MTAAAAPRPAQEAATLETRVGFPDVIDIAVSESIRHRVWCDDFAAQGAAAGDELVRDRIAGLVRYHERRAAIFDVIGTIFSRISGDDVLKERLRELAERAAAERDALAALDQPDDDETTS